MLFVSALATPRSADAAAAELFHPPVTVNLTYDLDLLTTNVQNIQATSRLVQVNCSDTQVGLLNRLL